MLVNQEEDGAHKVAEEASQAENAGCNCPSWRHLLRDSVLVRYSHWSKKEEVELGLNLKKALNREQYLIWVRDSTKHTSDDESHEQEGQKHHGCHKHWKEEHVL